MSPAKQQKVGTIRELLTAALRIFGDRKTPRASNAVWGTTMSEGSHRIRFALFQVDVRAGEIFKNGFRLRLQEQPFQVLLALLERPGEVVTRQELRERVWPSKIYLDFDRGLNRAMNKLRVALNDDPANPRFIETVARRGYRLIVSVQHDPPPRTQSAAAGRIRLAVLPLRLLSLAAGQSEFSDGLTEELIAQLGRLSPARLGIIARTSAMQYGDGSKSVEQIARELNLDYLLEGSVRCVQSRVRVTLQLIQGADQTQAWAGSYEREFSDVLTAQNEIAAQASKSLGTALLPAEAAAREEEASSQHTLPLAQAGD